MPAAFSVWRQCYLDSELELMFAQVKKRLSTWKGQAQLLESDN